MAACGTDGMEEPLSRGASIFNEIQLSGSVNNSLLHSFIIKCPSNEEVMSTESTEQSHPDVVFTSAMITQDGSKGLEAMH